MATRGWGGSIALAIGVGAGAAAAQLGVAYGLGIVTWPTATDPAGERAWLAGLAWTTWIAATATVLGAIVADRLSPGEPGAAPQRRRPGSTARVPAGPMATTAWRLVLALTAAVGGLLTVALVAVPARAAHRQGALPAQAVAGGYAVVGVVVGVLVALAALSARAIAANTVLTTAYVWLLGTGAVLFGLAAGGTPATAQLGVWHFSGVHLLRQTYSPPGAALMLGAALVIGVVAAAPAIRRGDNPVGVAVSGAFGPLLVSSAYFFAAPPLSSAGDDDQLSAYAIAPYAALVGLFASVVLVALAAQRAQRLAAEAAAATTESPARSEESLPEDAYAPARAYEPAEQPALVTNPGPMPLWPTQPEAPPEESSTEEITEARPAGKGFVRRLGRR
jgi:hypothetical protein